MEGLFIGFIFLGTVFIVLFCVFCLRICTEWERKVVLRLGRFAGVRGPGIFLLLPLIETTPVTIDLRTMTNSISAEQTLTRDNVPVNVDTVVYWRVVEPKLAVLQVADYDAAVILAAQTALRDMIGRSDLSEVLSDRAGLDKLMTQVLDAQTEPWGVKVESVQMRDIKIPDNLQDAMSRVAQAAREGQARMLLGDSELNIAKRFADAGKVYEQNPMAVHLRGMNMLYEVMKAGGTSTVIVPSTAVESMSFGGITGVSALAKASEQTE
ncbi:MAG: slipin family protein [Cyanobacteria bacterium TGS_CYA1]|nr:slipin family protein [Cyanobacteria bacterium TGS_CYA1]